MAAKLEHGSILLAVFFARWLDVRFATEAAAYFGKRVDHFLANDETKSYIGALCEPDNTRNVGDYVKAKRGRNGGTWFHPELAVFFARWLDIRFAIWCDRRIRLEVAIIAGDHPPFCEKKPPPAPAVAFLFVGEVDKQDFFKIQTKKTKKATRTKYSNRLVFPLG
jgi:hypothetical protein